MTDEPITRRSALAFLGTLATLGGSATSLLANDDSETALRRIQAAHEIGLKLDPKRGTAYVSIVRRVLAGDVNDLENDQKIHKMWNLAKFNQEFKSVIDEILTKKLKPSIVEGTPDSAHPDCVAVKTRSGWDSSGVLVSDRVILTAAHVYRNSAEAIWVGPKIDDRQTGQLYSLNTGNPRKDKPSPSGSDIAILVLADKQRVKDFVPKPRADAAATNNARRIIAVGYGSTDSSGTGRYAATRLAALMIQAMNPCEANNDFGCKAKVEFVAGGARGDTCKGDSGGGAYSDGKLVGITSRGVKGSEGKCGLGGVFVRVAEESAWIEEMIAKNK